MWNKVDLDRRVNCPPDRPAETGTSYLRASPIIVNKEKNIRK